MRKIETLPSGRFQVRFRHGTHPDTGRPVQTSESFDKTERKRAEQFAARLDAVGAQEAIDWLYSGEQGTTVPTLDEVAAAHIEHLEASDGHRVKMERLWERTWSPRVGSVRADLITRPALIKALTDLARNGKAPGVGYAEKSMKNQRGLLHGVLDLVVEEGHLKKHPGKRLKLPETTHALDAEDDDDPAEMVCLTPEQFDVLHSHFTPRYRAMVRFMVGTGCRWGEVVVLRKRDLNLSAAQPTARVRRALKWSPDGEHTIGAPKTKRSKRTIVLPSEVAADLRELVKGKADGDFVFTAARGGMIWHRTFWSDFWRPAIFRAQRCAEHSDAACRCGTAHPKRCKVHDAPPPPCGCPGTLGERPRIHDMRHTHASWLLDRGVPIHVVSARLGHESITTTVNTYGHLLPDAQLAAAAAADLAFTTRPPELT